MILLSTTKLKVEWKEETKETESHRNMEVTIKIDHNSEPYYVCECGQRLGIADTLWHPTTKFDLQTGKPSKSTCKWAGKYFALPKMKVTEIVG